MPCELKIDKNDKTTDNDKKDGLDWTMLGRCRRTSQLGINDTTAGLGGRWSAVDLLAVCSLPEWVLLADSLVLAKTCVCEPVWPLCAAMRRVVQARMAEESRRGGGEEEEGESRSERQICEREKGWEKQRVAGPGDKFQPILCAREGSSDRHGGRPDTGLGQASFVSILRNDGVAAPFAPG